MNSSGRTFVGPARPYRYIQYIYINIVGCMCAYAPLIISVLTVHGIELYHYSSGIYDKLYYVVYIYCHSFSFPSPEFVLMG